MTEKPSDPTSTRVRLTPSTAIEPLETMSGVQAGSIVEGEELPLTLGRARGDGRRVDMPLDEMAAQAVAYFRGSLEVHTIALSRSPRFVRARSRVRPVLEVQVPAIATTVRQQPLIATLSPNFSGSLVGLILPVDREATARALNDHPLEPTQTFHQPCEHVQLPRCSSAKPECAQTPRPSLW